MRAVIAALALVLAIPLAVGFTASPALAKCDAAVCKCGCAAGRSCDCIDTQDLARFIPPWIAPDQFRTYTLAQWKESRKFLDWSKDNRCCQGHRLTAWDEMIEDANRCSNAWDWLDNAAGYRTAVERDGESGECGFWLKQVRQAIGDHNYALGWRGMPPVVPYWRFPERD